jgi:FkbM family methyltransferase
MTITSLDQANYWYGQLVPNSIRLCRDWYGLKNLEFKPRNGSPLQAKGDPTVRLVTDYLMCQITLGNHRWQIEELEFAKRACVGSDPITLIDIGANMGLFSRQLMIGIPAIRKVFAYEPERENFACLLHNLAPFGEKAKMIEAAVSNASGEAEFFLDPTNNGNYSLAVGAMPPSYTKTIVKTVNVSDECRQWTSDSSRIFYKSDTEGLDEWVASLIPSDFWPRVMGGIIELWNIANKPALNTAAFTSMLDSFPNKRFLGNANTKVTEIPVSTSDVFNYIHTRAQPHRDLAFWR